METKNCQNCKAEFTINEDDFSFYQKIKVPPPTFCPLCRDQRRLTWRNERFLYKRNCDSCGMNVVSRISPDKKYKMYCPKCYYNSKWDPFSYGRAYDFSRPFFEQFKDLLFEVPHIAIQNSNSVNSDWVNQESDDKNCYLNIGGHYNEDSAYNTYEMYGKYCFDNYWILNSDQCSSNINCEKCFNTHYSNELRECISTYFSYDCRNCSNIIGCAGLRNKKYCIFNVQQTKEEYENFLEKNPLGSHKTIKSIEDKSKKIWLSAPHRFSFQFQTNNVSGNYIEESKNTHHAYYATKMEDCKYIYTGGWSRDSYDFSAVGACELCYECASEGGMYDTQFTSNCFTADPFKKIHASDLRYCFFTISSHHCFGCAGISNGEYTILNRRYSKEEYESLLLKIRRHMDEMPYMDKVGRTYRYGEFFPSEISPYSYHETTAIDYFPLKKEEAIKNGYNWQEYISENLYKISEYEIPDNIKEIKDDIIEKNLACVETGKAYKITPLELEFYRRAGLPIPRLAPNIRHKKRFDQMLPRTLWHRSCMCTKENHDHKETCSNEFDTSYAPERPEIVYCESCYQKEVI